ncbi:hypothetical protein, partial [Coleofasciculus sp.]|uniref:hypothetical protein n=1 Tax=Coleofasciculus sp. TaxID=3100458 RepID=UPI0039F930C2
FTNVVPISEVVNLLRKVFLRKAETLTWRGIERKYFLGLLSIGSENHSLWQAIALGSLLHSSSPSPA